MPKKFEPTKLDNGTYQSAGLSDKQFNQLFNQITKAQVKARKSAKRTLKPHTLNNPTSKALKALGEKAKGARFTKADLQKFDKQRQKHQTKYDSKTAGITYNFLVKNSRKIDVDRANNRVDDGTGITRATLIGTKGNIALIRVKASLGSKHQEHKVQVRLEQWDELLNSPPDGDYQKAAQMACAGRISIECDCGRHQYWYRYLATMGNYQIKPPSEFAFPKIKNPELSGVGCKHILKATTMLQSKAWQRILAKRMEQDAKRTGFGSTRTKLLSKEEKKEAAKNRKTITDPNIAAKEFKKYQRATKAFQDKMLQDRDKVKQQARQLRKERKVKNQYADMLKAGFQNFADGYKVQGKTKGEAIKDYAKMMNASESMIRRLAK